MKIATIISISAKSPVDEKLARARPFAVIKPSIIVPEVKENLLEKSISNILRCIASNYLFS